VMHRKEPNHTPESLRALAGAWERRAAEYRGRTESGGWNGTERHWAALRLADCERMRDKCAAEAERLAQRDADDQPV